VYALRYTRQRYVTCGWLNEKWKLVDGVAMIDYKVGFESRATGSSFGGMRS
jgi:hypothetical protein